MTLFATTDSKVIQFLVFSRPASSCLTQIFLLRTKHAKTISCNFGTIELNLKILHFEMREI